MAPEERTVASATGAATETAAAAGVQTQLLDTVSWGAVVAGTVVALVSQILLSLVGIGIGASVIDPGTSDNPSAGAFSAGAAIWWLVSAVLATGAGAYVAGRLSGRPRASTGAWHGLITFALTTLLTVTVLGSAMGGALGGALGTVSGAANTDIVQDPQLRGAADSVIRAAVGGDPQQVERAREQAADALAEARGISTAQAEQQIREFEARVRNGAPQAATTVSRAAWVSALALVLGGAAAWFAGRLGTLNLSVRMPQIRRAS
jgi:hypothetical protein